MSSIGGFNIFIMEKKFASLTIFDFQAQFTDDKACMDYLSRLKWAAGFVCPKCILSIVKVIKIIFGSVQSAII
jgi:hypothetical protein